MISIPRAKILVVDDELLNRRLIQAILGPEGHEIITCANGEHALELIATGSIDLVLLDVMMPGIDGIEVCRRIRTELDNPLLPVIIISALADPVSRTRGKQAGADDFLTKPVHEDELLVRVRNLLLLRAYVARAKHDARRWKLASAVATALAGCLDYGRLTAIVFERLRDALGVETVALFSGLGDELELLASAGDRLPVPDGGFRFSSPPQASAGAHHIEVLPVVFDGERVGACFVSRSTPFTAEERDLLGELVVHVGNAVEHVRSHLATVARLLRARSERESAEAALRASEARHRILFDASPLPIWVFDPRTLHVLAANEAAVTTLGYSRDELLGMQVRDLELVETNAIAAPRNGHTHRVGVRRYLRKDKTRIELDVTTHATMLEDELVILAVGVDVTQSRRLEDQLRQSQKMDAIGQLAGGVAHDFNNMLAAILSNAELARDDLGDSHPNATDLREIECAAQRAAVLTRQLLTFSRQERREVKVLAFNDVVRDIQKMLSRLVPEDIAMCAVLDASTGAVEGDAGQLEQVLMNLVVNARDAMPEGGRLTIETSNTTLTDELAAPLGVTAGSYVVLAVSDTGCGMDAATQARIFEPFFTTKPVGKGTGLGLATVFGIVKQSQGAVAVYSELGRGSTFRIYLPRVDQVAASSEQVTATKPHGTGSILIVEDDVMLRSVIKRQLTSWGYTTFEASNGAIALDLLASLEQPIDLLLTDLVMPGLDGHTLARKIVAERPSTKVLYMSGYTEHVAVKSAAIGADSHFIAKPFSGSSLSTAIQRALSS